MTKWQKSLVFWQQPDHVEMYIVLINTTNQVRKLYIFSVLMIEYLVATPYELWMM